jgi:wingless-type MMTV integration site family protein 6
MLCINPIHSTDTRETAFVNAITAAGISYTIAKSCSMGELVECSCDKNLVRHNVLLNNQLTTTPSVDGTRLPATNTNTNSNNHHNFNSKNRNKKPRRNHNNGNGNNKRNANKRKAPDGLPGMPGMGENWEWSGCDDNVNFGNRKSKDFLDARYRRRSDIKTLVRIHNNDAGRMVSAMTVVVVCVSNLFALNVTRNMKLPGIELHSAAQDLIPR